jgi:hypothetical protein
MCDTLKRLGKEKEIKLIIGAISNVYFDLSEISDNVEEDYRKLKSILSYTDYILIPAYPVTNPTEVKDYRFFIIRNVDLFATEVVNKKLRLFAANNSIGKLVGKNGYNITMIHNYLNKAFRYVVYYFPTMEDVSSRPINSDYSFMVKKLKELIEE